MSITFTRATKDECRLRLCLIGISGGGKTFTSLGFAENFGEKTVLLDSERKSASKYADLFSFDKFDLESGNPAHYIECIKAAGDAGYDTIIIDSLSHAWSGKEGALELVDQAAKRSKTGNSFSAWKEVNPVLADLLDAILTSPAHVIATLRAKTEYVSEKNDQGRTVIRKVGLQPVYRDQIEFEFDVVADMDLDNNMIISKTRCVALNGKVIAKPGADTAKLLLNWCNAGAAPVEKPAKKQVSPRAKDSTSTTGGAKDAGEQTVTTSTPADDAVSKEMLAQLGTVAEKNGWSKKALTAFCIHAFGLDPKAFKLTEKQWKTAVGVVQQEKNKGGKVVVTSDGKDLAPDNQWEYKAV